MKWTRAAAVAALAALLAACGAPSQENAVRSAPEEAASRGSAATPQEATVFDDVVGTQERARAVEAAAAEHQRELQRALEDAEGK